MISAIILSAGSSNRMGTSKALLKIGEKTFLQNIVDGLHQSRVLDVVIVLGFNAGTIQPTLSWFDGNIAINKDWEQGQLSSIVTGLNRLEQKDLHAVIVCPVDHPLVSQSVVVDLLHAFWKSHKKIIIPVFEGRRGHPVIFSKDLFDELRNAPPDVGARAVVHAHPGDICEVPVNEKGVVSNIDTPQDYEQYILHRQ